MSAMIGSGEAFLISTIAWAASLVGTATRTMRQFASLSRAISFRVALTSRVSALVIDCTTISAAPPITTSPTLTGIDLRRGLMASSQHIVICHKSDQSKQESEPDVVDHLLPGRVDRPAANQLQDEERRPASVERRKREDVRQPQAQAEEGDHAGDREGTRLGRARGGFHDSNRALQAAGSQKSTQTLVRRELVDAARDGGDRFARLAHGQRTCLERPELAGGECRMKTEDVTTGALVELRGGGDGSGLTVAFDDDRHGRVLRGIQGIRQVFESRDRVTVDRLDHVAGLKPGGAGRRVGINR